MSEPPLALVEQMLREQRLMILQLADAVKDLARTLSFEERRRRNAARSRIDNSTLPAGMPMIYYCKLCGAEMMELETHVSPPPQRCGFCISEGRE